jgi:subtilisin family serine protease
LAYLRLLIALMLAVTITSAAWAAPGDRKAEYVQGEILVKFRSGTPPETIERFGGRMKTSVKRKPNFIGVQLLSLPPDLSVEKALAEYRNHPDVLYAEPNYIRRAFAAPNDPDFDQQWGLQNIGQTINTNTPFNGSPDADIDAPEAWDIFQSEGRVPGRTPDGTPLIIAVIDTGVDYTHPDLLDNILPNGWNFVGTQDNSACPTTCDCSADDPVGNNDPMDNFGHGTHVAGIAAARGNNVAGISGVLWNAKILPLKILDANGCGSVEDEVQAIEYAIANGARIINASFGAPGLSSAEEDAIEAANQAGIVFVAAAGNESSDNDQLPIYPAGSDRPNVISVAASNSNDRLTPFSNYGKNRVDVAAPGDCILSTMPLGNFYLRNKPSGCLGMQITANYAYLSGTSMSTPYVTGAAGLLLSQDPSLTPEEVRAIILATADPGESLKGFVASAGRLNVSSALRRVQGSGLIGGSGGCGFPIAMIRSADRGATPPVEILLFLLGMFWPLLIPMIRKNLRQRRAPRILLNRRMGAAASGLLALMILWPPAAAAAEEDPLFMPVHSLALKMGHHRYDHSEYLDTNSGFLSRSDLAGLSGEMEYDWRWKEDASLSVTAGRYRSRTDLKNVCCGTASFSTNYLLFTPKYYSSIGPLEWYVGGGIGYYSFKRTIRWDAVLDLGADRLSANLAGIHAVIGLNWPVLPRLSIFTEARYALAKVKSADDFNDALDVGGLNYSLGISYRFSMLRRG